ncbi:hypothetical protein EMGBS6_15350 [Opitutia bacterium]|nr:hypothetical protein EMGBS6_15350 [Opitutae bacterium]
MRSLLALLLLAPLAVLTAADKPKAAPQAPKKTSSPDAADARVRCPGRAGLREARRQDFRSPTATTLVGPTYVARPETKAVEGVSAGQDPAVPDRFEDDAALKTPASPREEFGNPGSEQSQDLIVKTHTIDYKRTITVYIPAQYVPGTAAPLLVTPRRPRPRQATSTRRASRQPDRPEAHPRPHHGADRQRWRRRPGTRTR